MRMAVCLFAVLSWTFFLIGCSSSGQTGPQGPGGPAGPEGPSGVEIHSLIADPSIVKPGEKVVLTVSAADGAGSDLTFQWHAAIGSLSATNTNPVIWVAPTNAGSVLINVEVANGTGSKATGFVSVLVSVNPAGPIVTSVTPTEAKIGNEIRVTGSAFGSSQETSSLIIGGVAANNIVSWSDTEIHAIVPDGASTGSVRAIVAGVDSSPGYLVVLWDREHTENVPISTATGDQRDPQLISDGAGGAIIVWEDRRNGNFDIYVQRVNASGAVQWAAGGVAISTAANDQQSPQLISDGAGGAIIAWTDSRSGPSLDIYAQRVNRNGVTQWVSDGIPISAAPHEQSYPQLISDGNGGAIIAWQDDRNGVDLDIYVQRVDGNGGVQWASDGVPISTAVGDQIVPRLISDGTSGAIITWEDYQSGTEYDIYAQRINESGVVKWTSNGIAIAAMPGDQRHPQLIPDGLGGAIITWEDERVVTSPGIYAQRISGSGLAQWAVDGVTISMGTNKFGPVLVSDNSNGAIIAWEDGRSGTNSDIYAQRINGTGVVQWTPNGIPISTEINNQFVPQLISDGAGGAIIVWMDFRNIVRLDIYAQRVNGSGMVQWTADGVAISTTTDNQLNPQLVSDRVGGAIIIWQDYRSGTNYDIYAQGISASGRE